MNGTYRDLNALITDVDVLIFIRIQLKDMMKNEIDASRLS